MNRKIVVTGASKGKFSDYALNMMATRLSEFRKPTIPELILGDEKTLQNHMFESVLGVFGGEGNKAIRFIVTNLGLPSAHIS